MKLTALKIKNLKEPGTYPDGRGLSLVVTPTGAKKWRCRYRLSGKQKIYTIGDYPEITLSDARCQLKEVKQMVKQGLDPVQERKKVVKLNSQQILDDWETSFKNIAQEWIGRQRNVWSHNHAQHVLSSLKLDVFPAIGAKQIESISPPEILEIIQSIEGRGSLEMAKKALQRMSAVFRYAIQTGKLTYNPASEMKGVLLPRKEKHMPALYDDEFKSLVSDIAKSTHLAPSTKLCLQFTMLTACRSGETRNAVWSEININKREWLIPASRMKMTREHIVPLSDQAISILERCRTLFGDNGLVFPAARNRERPMSDNAMSKALRDMGYKGKATPHGFRSSFSSMAYESNMFPGEVIEKCLAHEERNKVKGAYNRAEYLEQRRELLQWWGDLVHSMELPND